LIHFQYQNNLLINTSLAPKKTQYIFCIYCKLKEQTMTPSTVFTNNCTQVADLPTEMPFPDSVKKVEVRALGLERTIAPTHAAWDRFFLGAAYPTEDFMVVRADQPA
jgi:antitoxin VapB